MMWGEDGFVLSVLAATLAMGVSLLAAFVGLDGRAMWFVVALVIGCWALVIRVLASRYDRSGWPFGRSDPWEGQ